MLADNVSSHKVNDLELSNVKLYFLPPNTTTQLQPLDQGIIYSLKVELTEDKKKFESLLKIVSDNIQNDQSYKWLRQVLINETQAWEESLRSRTRRFLLKLYRYSIINRNNKQSM